jgi:uncharacterized membrane protein
MRIVSVGQAAFAAIMIVIGIMGLAKGDFAPLWDPVPKGAPLRELLIYCSAFVSLVCGAGLLWRPAAGRSSCVLLVFLLAWWLGFRLPVVLRAPADAGSWEGSAETTAIIAGVWALYAGLAGDWERQRLPLASGDNGVRVARVIYGLTMIPFGVAHFAYLKETAGLVPGWLPAHEVWAGFTGAAYIAAGIAVVTGVCARLAAALSALQMGLFTLLVWLPIVTAAGPKTAFQWSETVISAALTAAGWVVAESYRGRRWFGVRQH